METPKRRRQLTLFAAVAFLFLASSSSFSFSRSRHYPYIYVGERERRKEVAERVLVRRRLGGPGSWPPSCRSKCGRCWPCKPVHVPIHPGFSMKLEYYPEAWRCKCRDKIFMP